MAVDLKVYSDNYTAIWENKTTEEIVAEIEVLDGQRQWQQDHKRDDYTQALQSSLLFAILRNRRFSWKQWREKHPKV